MLQARRVKDFDGPDCRRRVTVFEKNNRDIEDSLSALGDTCCGEVCGTFLPGHLLSIPCDAVGCPEPEGEVCIPLFADYCADVARYCATQRDQYNEFSCHDETP